MLTTPTLRLLSVIALTGAAPLLAQPTVTSLVRLVPQSGVEIIRPSAINNLGEIVGGAMTFEGEEIAIRYSPTGVITPLHKPVGASYTHPTAINNQGVVSGYYNDPAWNEYGAVWQPGPGAPTPLGLQPGGVYTYAEDINDSGVVVGSTQIAGNQDRAFVWTAAGGITVLPTFGGTYAYGSGINNQGLVTGTAANADDSGRAFIWDGTSLQELPPHPSNVGSDGYSFISGSTTAYAINDHGQVVGTSSGLNGTIPVVWENGEAIFLGSFGNPNSNNGSATDINNHGMIVGSSYLVTNFSGAFVYVDGVMYALNDLAAPLMSDGISPGFTSLTHADAINDLGQIVGYGDYWDGEFSNTQGFVLNLAAVPEPSSFALLAGVTALGCVTSRRRRG